MKRKSSTEPLPGDHFISSSVRWRFSRSPSLSLCTVCEMRKTLNEIKSLLEPAPEPYRRYVHLMLSISLTNTNTHTARTTGVPMCVHKQNGFFDFDLFYELFSLSVWVYTLGYWFFRFSPSSIFYFTPSPPQAIWINSFSISHSLSHSSLNLSQHKHLTCKSKWIIPPSFSSLSFVFVCTTEYCITSDNVFFYNDMFIVVAVANADANDDAAVVGGNVPWWWSNWFWWLCFRKSKRRKTWLIPNAGILR